MKRSLIITADDFGLSVEVNEAVEAAHREGVLTCASLLVTGNAVEDAVRRARRMPSLGVGLHLALVGAPPASPPETIQGLMSSDGSGLGERPMLTGAWMAVSRKAQAQVRREMRAQLDLYRRSGLALDHVDGHWHVHQHPFVHRQLVRFAVEFGIKAVRVPKEPPLASWRAAGRRDLRRRMTDAAAHRLIIIDMQRNLRHAGILQNDWFFGKTDGGGMDLQHLLGVIRHLPPGVGEIGLHPAVRRWSGPHAPPSDWRAEEELAALLSPALAEACRSEQVSLIRFGDLQDPLQTGSRYSDGHPRASGLGLSDGPDPSTPKTRITGCYSSTPGDHVLNKPDARAMETPGQFTEHIGPTPST